MSIIRTHEKAWESVPRAAAENLDMSAITRGVLFWLLTRPANWEVRVGAMQHMTGISAHLWQTKVRPELEKTGYLVVKRGRGKGGKIAWRFDVFSVPKPPKPSTIPKSVRHGAAMPGEMGD